MYEIDHIYYIIVYIYSSSSYRIFYDTTDTTILYTYIIIYYMALYLTLSSVDTLTTHKKKIYTRVQQSLSII